MKTIRTKKIRFYYYENEEQMWQELLEKLDQSIDLQQRAIDKLKEISTDSHLKSAITMIKK